MKVTTWNVNGIRARLAQVHEWIEREQPDALCLQEIKASVEHVPESLCALEGYWCYWHGHKGYSGVGLLLKRSHFPDQPTFFHPAFDHETRIVCAQAGGSVLSSVYVPNGGKDFDAKIRFLEALSNFVSTVHAEGKQLILCGDMNVARTERDVHPALRKPEAIGQTPRERQLIESLVSSGLVDLGRHLDPDNDRLFTWWAPWRNLRQKNVGWRLDYVLSSEGLARTATGCISSREFGTSDHAPVTAFFGPTPGVSNVGEAQGTGPGTPPSL
jgi:exodeoxyribonuclease III